MGTAVAGVGMFLLYGNLAAEFTRVSHLLGTNGSAALGVLPAVILSLVQVLQAYAACHLQFLKAMVEHILVTSWPLLLVTAGTVLSRNSFTGQAQPTSPKKD